MGLIWIIGFFSGLGVGIGFTVWVGSRHIFSVADRNAELLGRTIDRVAASIRFPGPKTPVAQTPSLAEGLYEDLTNESEDDQVPAWMNE